MAAEITIEVKSDTGTSGIAAKGAKLLYKRVAGDPDKEGATGPEIASALHALADDLKNNVYSHVQVSKVAVCTVEGIDLEALTKEVARQISFGK
jgi:hypothetical protein